MCSSFFFFFRAYNFSLRVWRVLLSERRSQTCWDYSERQKRGLQYRPYFGNQKHRGVQVILRGILTILCLNGSNCVVNLLLIHLSVSKWLCTFALQSEAQQSSAGEQLCEEQDCIYQIAFCDSGLDFLSNPLFALCKWFYQCQEKPTNESLAILFIHSTVIVQVLLQVRECALQFVICVRHSLAAFFLVCEQVWHIKVQTTYSGSQASMTIASLSGL